MAEKTPKLLLALGHKQRSGKDSAATFIIQERGNTFKTDRINFADALRKEVNDACNRLIASKRAKSNQDALKLLCERAGVPFDENAVVEAAYPFGKQRKLLQHWGTEYRRAQDPDYWIKRWKEAVAASEADVIIATDLRFVNEMQAVHEMNGQTIKFVRVGYVPDPETAAHYSENALNDAVFDHKVTVNDGNLDDLRVTSLHVFDYIMHQHQFGW